MRLIAVRSRFHSMRVRDDWRADCQSTRRALDERGSSAPSLTVSRSVSVLQVSSIPTTHAHQIYSNDCNELPLPYLQPGEALQRDAPASAASYATPGLLAPSPPATPARCKSRGSQSDRLQTPVPPPRGTLIVAE